MKRILTPLIPPTTAPSLCNNNSLKSCPHTLSVILPFSLQHTPAVIPLPPLHCNCSFKVTNVLLVAKANQQFSDFVLFDLSFDTIDYVVLNILASLGFQRAILSWLSSHFAYILLLGLHGWFLLLSHNVNVEISQDSVLGLLFFSTYNVILSHGF